MTEHMLNAHNYTEYEFCRWCFSSFPKIFRTAILKENLSMDVPYFIKEHLWMSAFDEPTLKKLTLKQTGIAIVAAVMVL